MLRAGCAFYSFPRIEAEARSMRASSSSLRRWTFTCRHRGQGGTPTPSLLSVPSSQQMCLILCVAPHLWSWTRRGDAYQGGSGGVREMGARQPLSRTHLSWWGNQGCFVLKVTSRLSPGGRGASTPAIAREGHSVSERWTNQDSQFYSFANKSACFSDVCVCVCVCVSVCVSVWKWYWRYWS